MKKILAMTIFLAVGSLCCPGQENVNSPSATEFVRYERIPVSYFNGLPSIEIPVYTVETKDLYLPISLSYHASGIKVNQYPTAVGLGWALNAGGGITRIVNGIPDETCAKDMTDLTGSNTPRDPGYYFSSAIFMNDNWNKEEGFNTIYTNNYLDTEPDEFVINAYGLSSSIYFYRDQDGNVMSKIKNNNGESFKVEIPVMVHNPEEITFHGIAYSPHNYSQALTAIQIYNVGMLLKSAGFAYTSGSDERLKLKTAAIRGIDGKAEQVYRFEYDPLKLPAYNSTVTDNWGYWNNKNYRDTDIEEDFFGFRSASLEHTMAETLTGITWPTGGHTLFEYELNDYSRIATQAPDFDLIEKAGTAGGLRIKKITYTSDTTSYTHCFEYKNEDGTSSGILSGIPVYIARGNSHASYDYSSWESLVYFREKGDIRQNYIMRSESYINTLGLTTGNHVTYSRVVELIGDSMPFKKEYRYTNHDSCPDTADFEMYTNIDNVALDNKFTSRALMRGLLTDEIWYSDMGLTVKETRYTYGSSPGRTSVGHIHMMPTGTSCPSQGTEQKGTLHVLPRPCQWNMTGTGSRRCQTLALHGTRPSGERQQGYPPHRKTSPTMPTET